jgi:lanthanide-dependent methanol dehydrogenase
MYPAPQEAGGHGGFIAWDPVEGKVVWEVDETFAVWSGALTTAGGLAFYGTLEGYVKAVDQKTGEELWRFKTPYGIIGNVNTFMHEASSTLPCCPGSAAGQVSVLRPG